MLEDADTSEVGEEGVDWWVVEMAMRTFTLIERLLVILFLGMKLVRNELVGIMMLVCQIKNRCLVSLTLANEKCLILLMT